MRQTCRTYHIIQYRCQPWSAWGKFRWTRAGQRMLWKRTCKSLGCKRMKTPMRWRTHTFRQGTHLLKTLSTYLLAKIYALVFVGVFGRPYKVREKPGWRFLKGPYKEGHDVFLGAWRMHAATFDSRHALRQVLVDASIATNS